jgi:hypothetical protein
VYEKIICMINKRITMADKNQKKAVKLLLQCLADTFDEDASPDVIHKWETYLYAIKKADYENVFFIKLDEDCPLARYCPLTKNKTRWHTGPSNKRSYCVNIATGKISGCCWSTKCQKRNNGRFILSEVVDTSDEDTSDDDNEDDERVLKKQKVDCD